MPDFRLKVHKYYNDQYAKYIEIQCKITAACFEEAPVSFIILL